MKSQESHPAKSALKAYAENFGSTENKAKWALVGTVAIAMSYVVLFAGGGGDTVIALAWPGMVLCAPFGYDLLCALINKSK